jgi:GNAT superfamily N-acetyltransferase
MAVLLRDMNHEEYAPFMKMTIEGYKQEKIKMQEWTPEEAEEMANKMFGNLLKDGMDTQNQHFKVITSDEKTVGYIWFEMKENIKAKIAFINFIFVLPECRGAGLGRKAIELLKELSLTMGANRIELHVFGYNSDAIRLYLNTGFEQTHVLMKCEI